MESYFDNIKEKVIVEFNNSEFMIYAAIAWITDFDIIKELTKIVKKGVQVELIINKDDKFLMRELQLNEFVENGGRLFLYPCDNDSIMHNKFCVIDLSTTITGSFNWSFAAATKNKENIIIARDNLEFSKNFAREFKKIKQSSILYESKKTQNIDLIHYVIVSHIQRMWADIDKGIVIFLKEDSKMCPLIINTNDLDFIQHFEVEKILGYWNGKSVFFDLNGQKQTVKFDDLTYYDFVCEDTNFFKYLNSIQKPEYYYEIGI
jgi:PLD-like domain